MSIVNKLNRVLGPVVRGKISTTGQIIDQYTHYYKTEQVRPKTVLYESRDGKSMTDSPLAIFEFLLKKDIKKEYIHIWVVTPSEELETMMSDYKDHSNVIFVWRQSDEYLKWLTAAEYLVNNSTFQPFVIIKEEQTYINTWHGTPLKTMGFDIPGNPADAKNVVRNFFMADYLISPNPHTTNMFLDSYRLRGGFGGEVIESGYPRIDQTLSPNSGKEVEALLARFNKPLLKDKEMVLYAPTWKGGNLHQAEDEINQMIHEMAILREKIKETKQLFIKVHPFLYAKASTYEELYPYLIPDVMDTNKLLQRVDLLITDYSSVFFDFLVTGKPIIFYCWDDDLYSNERGKYLTYQELPGPVAFNLTELLGIFDNLDEQITMHQPSYQACVSRFTPYDDGQVTERIVTYIFFDQVKGRKDLHVIKPNLRKKRLLFYPGGMRKNGITSSFINLMSEMDFDKYDVVCLLDNVKSREQINNVAQLPKEISLLFRFNHPDFTIKEAYKDLKYHLKGVSKKNDTKYPAAIYQREAFRLVGTDSFDSVIDFSGYSLNWAKIILGIPSKQYVCYLHSDMMQDRERTVNGRQIHKMNLTGIFSVYRRFDKLVSVSQVICDINRDKLKEYAEPEAFVYAENVINPDKILNKQSIEEKETDQSSKKTIRTKRTGILQPTDRAYVVHTTRPDMPDTRTQEVNFSSLKVDITGMFVMGEQEYYKVSQNHQYIGWIKEEQVALEPITLLEEKTVSFFGKLNTNRSSYFYSEPIGLSNSTALGAAGPLRNVYVKVSKQATTGAGTSLLITYKGQELGWINESAFRHSAKMSRNKGMKVSVMRHVASQGDKVLRSKALKKLAYLPRCVEDVQTFGRLSEPFDGKLYPVPNTTSEPTVVHKESLLEIRSIKKIEKQSWYEVRTSDGKVMWAIAEGVVILPVDKVQVFSYKSCYYEVMVDKEYVEIRGDREGWLDKPTELVKSLPFLVVEAEAESTEGITYIKVDWSGKKIWLLKSDTTKDTRNGVFNSKNDYVPFPDPHKKNMVIVGRLSPEKNHAVLIEAFAKLLKQDTAELYIIGAGPEEANIRNKIAEYGIEEHVHLTGQLENPYAFMAKCQYFVLTSDYEGQSLVLLEAMTLGLPIVSTDIPACREVLGNGKYGLLTKTNDVTGIAIRLKEILVLKRKFKPFNAYAYNRHALKLFDKIIND